MASIGEIIGRLGSSKSAVSAAKVSSENAGRQADVMATQAEGMDLEQIAAELRSVHGRIEGDVDKISALGDRVDGLIDTAELLRGAASGPGGRPEARPAGAGDSSVPASTESNGNSEGPGPTPESSAVSPGGSNSRCSDDENGVPSAGPPGGPIRPSRTDPDPDAVQRGRSDPEPLGWRQKALSARSASLATAAVTGASTTVAGAMGHLPGVKL